ncbi:MAG: hypothetical protein IIZ67_06130 [Bacilli bacterium]|nr:hypothetical protein [Bacilli bacterium]
MVYSEIVTSKTPFLEVTYPEIEDRKPKFNLFHLNRRNPERELFVKDFNEKEFIGEELCRIRGRASAHYFLVGINPNSLGRYRRMRQYGDVNSREYTFLIGSYDFRGSDKEYFDLSSLVFEDDSIDKFLSMCPNDENKKELLHEILDLMALDVFMGQEDRCGKNVMLEKSKDGSLHVAPLYDFQYSIKISSLLYRSVFHTFRSDSDYHQFMEQYGEFRDLLESYSDEDLYAITESGFKRNSMIIPENQKDFLRGYSKKRRQLIKNIIK